MTVKDGQLYIGSHGTEFPRGESVDHNLQVSRKGDFQLIVNFVYLVG